MIENEFFHHLTQAEEFLKQGFSDSLYNSIESFDTLLNMDVETNKKTYITAILSKLFEIYKSCDNQSRFMINTLISKHKSKFSEIFIKNDYVNSLISVLLSNDSTSRFYAIQILNYLPFLLDKRLDLIYILIDLFSKRSSEIEKKEIMKIILFRDKEQKFSFYTIFLQEVIENFEEIIEILRFEPDLKLLLLKVFSRSLDLIESKQRIQMFGFIHEYIKANTGREKEIILSLMINILYVISNSDSMKPMFNEFIKEMIQQNSFELLFSASYYLNFLNQINSKFMNDKIGVFAKKMNSILLSDIKISRNCFKGIVKFTVSLIALKPRELYSQTISILEKLSSDSSFKINFGDLLKFVYRLISQYNFQNKKEIVRKIFQELSFIINNNHLITKKDFFYFMRCLEWDCETLFSIIINFNMDQKFYSNLLKFVYQKNLSVERLSEILNQHEFQDSFELNILYSKIKKQPINNFHQKIQNQFQNTNSSIIQIQYKLLKFMFNYLDIENYKILINLFLEGLKLKVHPLIYSHYQQYFNCSIGILEFFLSFNNTRRHVEFYKNKEIIESFFDLKVLKYQNSELLNEFSKDFIRTPIHVLKKCFRVIFLLNSESKSLNEILLNIDSLLNSNTVCYLKKENCIESILSVKMRLLEKQNKVFNYQSVFIDLIFKMQKYFLILNEYITFNFDYRHNILKKEKSHGDKSETIYNFDLKTSLNNLVYYSIDNIVLEVNLICKDKIICSEKESFKLSEENTRRFHKKTKFLLTKSALDEGNIENIELLQLMVEIKVYFLYDAQLQFKFLEVKELVRNSS